MTCVCGTDFCYDCGNRYQNFIFTFGHLRNRNFRLIPFISCPKLWKSKAKRIAAHTAISTGVVAVGVLLAPLALVAVPTYFVTKVIRRRHRHDENDDNSDEQSRL